MKASAFSAFALASVLSLSAHAAEPWDFDKSHAHIDFSVSHLGYSDTQGTFGDFDGTLMIDQDNPANSSVSVTIQTESLNTFWAKRDEHLKSPDFFNVAEYPTITFTSTGVEQTGDDTLSVTGDFTMLGVTQPVTLDVTVNQIGNHPMSGNMHAGFTASGTLKRSEFGMNYGVPAIGDDVDILINIEASPAG